MVTLAGAWAGFEPGLAHLRCLVVRQVPRGFASVFLKELVVGNRRGVKWGDRGEGRPGLDIMHDATNIKAVAYQGGPRR